MRHSGILMSSCARRFFLLVLLCGFLSGAALPLFGETTEIEPNNDLSQPNQILCGDTIHCANLPLGDLDHYRFLVPGGDSLYCRTFPCGDDDTDTYITLFSDDIQIIAFDDDTGPMDYSMIAVWVSQTAYYRLRVMRGDQAVNADSTYSLFVNSRTPVSEEYDYCETARVVLSMPYFDEGDTFGKADNIGTDAPDVFYRFHQPVQSDIFLEVCSEFFNARVQILGYCMGNYLDDASEGCFDGATLITYALPPGDYYVLVEGVSLLDVGEYSLEISPYYPDCPDPTFLIVFPVGGQPALDWQDVPLASYYLILQSHFPDGPFEHLDVSPISYYVDPAGFAADQRFYQVVTVCPWSR